MIRENEAFRTRVRDVPLVPKKRVLVTDFHMRADHPGKTTEIFSRNRITLMGHDRGSLLSRTEAFVQFSKVGMVQMPDLDRDPFNGGSDERTNRQNKGDPIARNHLSGDRLYRKPEPGQCPRLECGIEKGVVPHCTGHLTGQLRIDQVPDIAEPTGELGPAG